MCVLFPHKVSLLPEELRQTAFTFCGKPPSLNLFKHWTRPDLLRLNTLFAWPHQDLAVSVRPKNLSGSVANVFRHLCMAVPGRAAATAAAYGALWGSLTWLGRWERGRKHHGTRWEKASLLFVSSMCVCVSCVCFVLTFLFSRVML